MMDLSQEKLHQVRQKNINKYDINQIFKKHNISYKNLPENIKERFDLLSQSNFLEDEFRCIEYLDKIRKNIFKFIDQKNQIIDFTKFATYYNDIKIATLFSDIGKTGPKNATAKEQKLILDMFQVENVKDPNIKVKDFLMSDTYFPLLNQLQRKENLEIFTQMINNQTKIKNINTMQMRDFWNLHTIWTYEILKDEKIDLPLTNENKIKEIAFTHHIFEGINPCNIDKNSLSDEMIITILLDKYDAIKNRFPKSHEESIGKLKDSMQKIITTNNINEKIVKQIFIYIDILEKNI